MDSITIDLKYNRVRAGKKEESMDAETPIGAATW